MVYSTGKRQKTVAKGRLLCETKNRYNRVIIELSFFLTTSDCNCNCSQVNWKNGAIFVSRVTLIETQQNQCHWINWREREKARKNNKLLVFSLEKKYLSLLWAVQHRHSLTVTPVDVLSVRFLFFDFSCWQRSSSILRVNQARPV